MPLHAFLIPACDLGCATLSRQKVGWRYNNMLSAPLHRIPPVLGGTPHSPSRVTWRVTATGLSHLLKAASTAPLF